MHRSHGTHSMPPFALRPNVPADTPFPTTPRTGAGQVDRSTPTQNGGGRGIVNRLRSGRKPMECALKPFLTFVFALLAAPALAHPGHIADLAGHDHWVAGAAIGAAIAAAIWGHLKGKKDEEEIEEDAEPEEQTA